MTTNADSGKHEPLVADVFIVNDSGRESMIVAIESQYIIAVDTSGHRRWILRRNFRYSNAKHGYTLKARVVFTSGDPSSNDGSRS